MEQVVMLMRGDALVPLRAFEDGLVENGIRPRKVDYGTKLPDAETYVTWLWDLNKYPYRWIRDRVDKKKSKVVVLNVGVLKREDYWQVGLNGIGGKADYRNRGCGPDRWKRLEIELESWRQKRGENLLLLGQVPWDVSLDRVDLRGWVEKLVKRLRKVSGRPIIFRRHPLDRSGKIRLDGVESSENSLEDDLRQAWMVLTYSSTSAVQAILKGIPVWCGSRRALAAPMAEVDLKRIENPRCPEGREQWAWELAYTQWTLDEMRAGLAWRHLMRD